MNTTVSTLSNLINDPDKKGDTSFWGVVKEKIIHEGACVGYIVSLGDDNDLIECRRLAGANVGDTVFVTVTANGSMTVTGRIDGDQDIIDTNTNISTNYSTTLATINLIYPVGSIYMSVNSSNPSTLFEGTTWQAYSQGRVLVGAGTSDRTFTAGSQGGESTHTLTSSESGQKGITTSTGGDHQHYGYSRDIYNGSSSNSALVSSSLSEYGTSYPATQSAGSHSHTIYAEDADSAHNNLQPYLVCYIWRRTA